MKQAWQLWVAGLALGAMLATVQIAPAQQVEEQLVTALDTLAGGPHAGHRANHAKGVLVQGTFTPAASAATVSLAPHFQGAPTPVQVRFSNATGVPTLPDADPNASPHGIAIRFLLADGAPTDIVSLSHNGFPAATPEDFLGLLQAVAASGPGAPKPTPIETWLGSHPAALAFVTAPKPAPVSFATLPYYGLNAFKFTNAAGAEQFGRYQILPVAGDQRLSEAETAAAGPDYLMQELPARLAQGPVGFRLALQLAAPGDPVNDVTKVWPDDRPVVDLGTLTLTALVPDGAAVAKAISFDPLSLTPGIEPSDDPILLVRPGTYAVSYSRRIE